MRALAATVVAVALLVTTVPAEAHPLPKTEEASRELVGNVLADVDTTGAKMLRHAQKLVKAAQRQLDALPLPEGPGATIGALEVRAVLTQPGVRGVDQLLGALWLGASEGHWTGVYWVESNGAGSVFPTFADVDEMGVILYLDGGTLATGSSVNVTYHFLGLDGSYTKRDLGEIRILDEMPVLGRADVGGAHASARGEEPEAMLITPWNLFDHNVTMGVTLFGGTSVLDDITVTACGDFEARETEPGCRLLYVLPFEAGLTHVTVWHLDENGDRVDDRTLPRATLLRGFTWS